jgi:hypothetical protein
MKYVLRYDTEWNVYVLTPYPQNRDPEDASFSMLIRYSGGEYAYRFVCHINGEWFYVNTRSELDERVALIAEHEGDEVATHWRIHQEDVHIVRDTHYIFEAKVYWEALMKIAGFSLQTTWETWPKRPINEKLQNELDVIRKLRYETQGFGRDEPVNPDGTTYDP